MGFFSYRKPKAPRKQGIILKSKRGEIGETIWGKLWRELIKDTDSARLTRGRTYARGGRITKLTIGFNFIEAEVQGSSFFPYKVKLTIANPYTKKQWTDAITNMAKKAVYLAHFLSGSIPDSIHEVFNDPENSLFPKQLLEDVGVSCSCYDWSHPCKHTSAVLYAITEIIDENPLLIFHIRGISQEKLINDMTTARKKLYSPSKEGSSVEDFWKSPEVKMSLSKIKSSRTIEALQHLKKTPWKVHSEKIAYYLSPGYAHLKKVIGEKIDKAKN